ncbi:RNA-binding domain-containing protein [Glonium stellatum]|uniref:RNA-binding domain-containing protein n=1 Tax=Glonium stellatum TaxID=574774 RepID=A0A8E2JQL4_9PEZI|nr:RNA-binding domain-containing protein [Glonium stellatum]
MSLSRSPSRSISRSPSRERGRRGRSRSYSRSPSRGSPPPRSSKIVVEKLSKNVNEDHLREIFGSYGQIQDLDLPINRQFMTNRGTAYIMFYETADAERAIAHMHEAQLDGVVINVSIVLPRRRFSRSPPPRRGVLPFDRFDNRGGPPGGYRGLPPGVGAGRYRSPRRRSPQRGYPRGGRGDNWYPRRSVSRSRSPRRSRSRSYSSRSPSRTPPPRRRGGYGRRDTPPRGGGRRRRSPSYSSYSSYSDRSRSRSRERGGRNRR